MTSEKSPSPGGPRTTPARLQLSSVQVLASALAAVTATIAGSFLGVNGTVIGAAVASVLTVTANAIYAHSLRRTGERMRSAAPVARARTIGHPRAFTGSLAQPAGPSRSTAAVGDTAVGQRRLRSSARFGWRRLGVATVAVFVSVLAVLTGVELATGRPVSDLLRGQDGSGTTVFGASGDEAARTTTPAPLSPVTVTRTVVPTVVVSTPTVTQTAPAVTVTPSPSTSAPATSETPSPSPSASGGSTP